MLARSFFALSSHRQASTIVPALFAASLLTACGGGGGNGIDIPGDQANDRVMITNTQLFLDARVTNMDEDVPVDAPPPVAPVLAGGPPPALAADTLALRLIREIAPPIVEGEVVQATSISLKSGNKAVVSYNMVGEPRLGAVDYFTKLDKDNPILSSEVVFIDSDISAVATDGKWVYAAEATNDPNFPFPAVLERFRLKSDKLILKDNLRMPLTSFAATSTLITKDEIYVTSGNTGEVFVFDEKDMEPLGQYPLDDARWVAWDKDGKRIVVAQGGTPDGQLAVFAEPDYPDESLSLPTLHNFPGANVPESKTTVEVDGDLAFIAAGPEGVQIMCLDDGQVVGSVPRPDPAELGLPDEVVVTNAVSVDDDLMFISNGEAGVYLAQATEKFDDIECTDPLDITMLGKLRFDDLQSANHVAFKGKYLFVAAGLGGVKVVRVVKIDTDDDD